MKVCIVCDSELPRDRKHSNYCSKKCQASIEGYDEGYDKKLRAQLEGTTAWRPLPIEPALNIYSSKPVMVFSDIHAPIHSPEWIHRGIKTAKKLKSDTLIINGDFIDANTISRHLGGYYRRKNELEDDLAAGEALMKIFAKNFKHVYFLSGNHCLQRLMHLFKGEVQAKRLWNLFTIEPNVKLTPRSWVIVNDKTIVGHPRSYSRIRGSLTQKIALVKQMNVMTGHHHHSALTATSDARYQAAEIGCMADLESFEYVKNELNDFPEPMNGYGIVFKDRLFVVDKYTPVEILGL